MSADSVADHVELQGLASILAMPETLAQVMHYAVLMQIVWRKGHAVSGNVYLNA